MTKAEAISVVAFLGDFFRADIPDETALVWAASLERYRLEDAKAAVETLGRGLRLMPSLRELEDAIKDIIMRRRESQTPTEGEGPYISFREFLEGFADDRTRERARSVMPRYFRQLEGL
jgi:hypothetical protein